MSHNPGDAATTAREPEAEQTQTPSAEQHSQGAQPATAQHPTADAIAESPAEAGQSFATDLSDNPQASAAETRNETFQAQAGGGQPQANNTDNQTPASQSDPRNAPISSASSAETPSPVQSASSATPQPTGEPDEGVANSANAGAATSAQEATEREFAPRPDVSDQNWQDLVPKLLGLFNNNREQLARALGLHRSTVDRWLNGKSKPNTSTILRMRRLAQERQVE